MIDIKLVDKEDVEKEGEVMEDIREEIIRFLNSKGYKYAPADVEFEDETNDFFVKEGQLIQVIINEEIPKEVLDYMIEFEEKSKKEKN